MSANRIYNLEFRLFDAVTGGNLLGTVTRNGVNVSNGLFTVQLDFRAPVFTGARRWLEIVVNGEPLDPRVEITSTPYPLFSFKPWETSGTNLFY